MKFVFYFLLLNFHPALAEQPAAGAPQTPEYAVPQNTPENNEAGSPGSFPAYPLWIDPAASLGEENEALQKFLHPKSEPDRQASPAPDNIGGRQAALATHPVDTGDFLAAHNAFLAGDAAKLGHYAQRLKKTPLEVYVNYYQLSLALKNAEAKPGLGLIEREVKDFLSRPADTPMINQLRGEWLKLLGKKQQWAMFDDEYPHMINEDTELACYGLQSHRRRDDQAALHEARKLWFSGKGQPDSCGTLFEAALSAGIISNQDVQQRLHLALEANNVSLAISLAEQLEGKHTGLPAMLKDAAADPARYLKKLISENSGPKKTKASATQTRIHAAIQKPVSVIEPPSFSGSPIENPLPSPSTLIPSPSADWFGLGNLLSRLGFSQADMAHTTVANTESATTDIQQNKAENSAGQSPPPGEIATTCPPPCVDARPDVAAPSMERHPKLASEGQRTVALFALQRLAKQSPDLAVARWEKIAKYFPMAEQRYFYGRLAYEAARNLDDRALQWYKEAAYTPLDDHQTAWRVRAALRTLNWPEVLAGVNAMSDQQQRDPAWRYWKARALQALGKPAEAREIFAPLSKDFYFYGQLASAELADSPIISAASPAYKPDQQAISAMLALLGVQRTLALYRMNLRSEALEEWRWTMRNLDDRALLTAAEIAKRNEMYDRAIGAADRTVSVHDFSMRYLAPYRAELQTHIRQHGLDEAWVYGLMRQESRFATSAKSDVGASGLMQIMPSTARWIAKKLGLKSYRNALIHQLDTNLRLGTYYMKTVLSQSENNPVLASAAYNAGPLRALQWRSDRPLEGAIYAETIPFEETRDYVKKVMSNTVYYAEQFGDPPRSLKQRLGIIAAKTAEKPAIP